MNYHHKSIVIFLFLNSIFFQLIFCINLNITTNSIIINTTPSTPAFYPTTTTDAFNGTEIPESYHLFYRMKLIKKSSSTSEGIFKDIDSYLPQDTASHEGLENDSGYASLVTLSFTMLFYGHEVNKVAIAKEGYIHMHDFLHSTLSFTQYVAPLMGNFLSISSAGSRIYYKDTGSALHVRWQNLYLSSNTSLGPFTFQASLYANGSIVFGYKKIPVPIESINLPSNSFNVGLSDGFYFTSKSKSGASVTYLYRYHAFNTDLNQCREGYLIFLTPTPTCNQRRSCGECLKPIENFTCAWCEQANLCSAVDDYDRNVQTWLANQCHKNAQTRQCAKPPSRIIVIILLCCLSICLIFTIIYWISYACKHPESRAGVCLQQINPLKLCRKCHQRTSNTNPYGVFYDNEIEA